MSLVFQEEALWPSIAGKRQHWPQGIWVIPPCEGWFFPGKIVPFLEEGLWVTEIMLAVYSGSGADAAQGQIHDVCKGHIVDLCGSASDSFCTTKARLHEPRECLEGIKLALGSSRGLWMAFSTFYISGSVQSQQTASILCWLSWLGAIGCCHLHRTGVLTASPKGT